MSHISIMNVIYNFTYSFIFSGNKRKRCENEEDENLAHKKKCIMRNYISNLLSITSDKLFKIRDIEFQLRKFVLLSNIEEKFETTLLS